MPWSPIDHARFAIDRDDALALVRVSSMPMCSYQSRMDDDVFEGFLARQHRRKHDAVIVAVRLGAEHRD